jgi:subtilisin family serine protease
MAEKNSHIKLPGPSDKMQYTSKSGRGNDNSFPERDRNRHGLYIKKCLDKAWNESEAEIAAVYTDRNGIYLEFESSPGFELAIKSLEDLGQGIRLCNVRKDKNENIEETSEEKVIKYATVFIPKDKIKIFYRKVEKYLSEETNKGNPKNQKLIESINDIRKALLVKSFWTDPEEGIPGTKPQWCEVWLRSQNGEVPDRFKNLLKEQDIVYKKRLIRFPERIVMLVYASEKQLAQITLNCDYLAEYRKAKHSAAFLLNQSPADQSEWVEDLLNRTNFSNKSQVSICLLDTGVNYGHPLIGPVLDANDCQAVDDAWQTHDHDSHGTLMAGLSVYGDLQHKLEGTEEYSIDHVLESVKILPISGQNDPELWGDITQQAVSLAEIRAPERKRIVCMSVTAHDNLDKGRPSSWSGAVDKMAFGMDDSNEEDEKYLVIVAAGNNTDPIQMIDYPDFQKRDSIHDPAQAWNALTVGAYTQLTDLTESELEGYCPLAKVNQLSPFSTTSLTWNDAWPIKPEVVFEGGNVAVDSDGQCTECEDMSLISTFFKPQERLLEHFNMTSAASAQAANFAAQIQTHYPDYWPETVRALIVHSANWPEELKDQFASNDNKTELKKVLRACGYGVPDLEKALYCSSNSLTLIAESELQPYKKENSSDKTNEMHLYRLPWPIEILEELGEIDVEMRVTLSYFIDPGPGEIGWKDRYLYPSHALRFDINSPTESEEEFLTRINREAQDNSNRTETQSASKYWVIGQARNKGSIHSDIWKGSAIELAASNIIAVYPQSGWWRKRLHLHKYNNIARYSLIVSIETPEQDVDIYTPVKIQVEQAIKI